MKKLIRQLNWIVLIAILAVPLACTKPGTSSLPAESFGNGSHLNLRTQAALDQAAGEELTKIQKELAAEQEAEE